MAIVTGGAANCYVGGAGEGLAPAKSTHFIQNGVNYLRVRAHTSAFIRVASAWKRQRVLPTPREHRAAGLSGIAIVQSLASSSATEKSNCF